jgi:hypothetical protein
MWYRRAFAAVAFVTLPVTGACEGENRFAAPALGEDNTFDAVEMEFRDAVGDTTDIVEEGGSFELTLDRDEETFRSRFQFLSIDYQLDGTFTVSEGRITFSDDPLADDELTITRAFDFTDAGDVIRLEDAAAVFDLDEDGTTETGELDILLQRR